MEEDEFITPTHIPGSPGMEIKGMLILR